MTLLFSIIYLHNHAYGAKGDDAPGYIYMAERLIHHQPLIYQDELGLEGLNAFTDERLARWLVPKHYEFINPDGWIAPRYPIGIALILSLGALVSQNDQGIYAVVPMLAALNVGLTFWLAIIVLHFHKYRWLIALVSAWALGVTTIYFELALSQPMREIPSLTFILLAMISLIYWGKRDQTRAIKKIWLLVSSALALGIAINIRETTSVLLPGIIMYSIFATHSKNKYTTIKNIGLYAAILSVALLPTVYLAIQQNNLQTPFKQRDVVLPSLVPNMDHITSIGLRNMFNDYGKYRPGNGALPHYWSVMSELVPLPWFLFFVLLGGVFLWQYAKKETWLLVSWLLSIIFMFSVWINPYSRYIIPLFPSVLILGFFGIIQFFELVISYLPGKRFHQYIMVGAVFIGGVILYRPAFSKIQYHFNTATYYTQSLSHQDLNNFVRLGDQLKTESPQPLFIFSGNHNGLPEVFEAHTGIKTIFLPLELRFNLDQEKLNTFFDQHIFTNYTTYIWLDDTTSEVIKQWLAQYDQSIEPSYSFSFTTNANIIRFKPKQ